MAARSRSIKNRRTSAGKWSTLSPEDAVLHAVEQFEIDMSIVSEK
jgi:hypothetical protein